MGIEWCILISATASLTFHFRLLLYIYGFIHISICVKLICMIHFEIYLRRQVKMRAIISTPWLVPVAFLLAEFVADAASKGKTFAKAAYAP